MNVIFGRRQNREVQLPNREFISKVKIWEPPYEIGKVGITVQGNHRCVCVCLTMQVYQQTTCVVVVFSHTKVCVCL